MGAGQIGGIATLLDIDFMNAPGFIGTKSENIEGNYLVYFLSHAVLFCAGALIEAHVVLTPAICIEGWTYQFNVVAGTHHFLEGFGVRRLVENVCVHRGYNRSSYENNVALLVLKKQFSLRYREDGGEYTINRVRYGRPSDHPLDLKRDMMCEFIGWGSRRNGFLVPLLIRSRKVQLRMLDQENCDRMWSYNNSYLCFEQPSCKDDIGTVVVCNGYLYGMMVSRLADRPCGIGFLDMVKYNKFLVCGVDDADDVYEDTESYHNLDLTTALRPHADLTTVVIPTKEAAESESLPSPDKEPDSGAAPEKEQEEEQTPGTEEKEKPKEENTFIEEKKEDTW